jgi:riboflavin biosynthesis pyrimidine reductase
VSEPGSEALRLFPEPAGRVGIVEAYETARDPRANRPWVVANFVASLDGAVSVGGRSGGLGGPTDKEAFRSLRAAADAILVGAGTVRAEGYGPARPGPDARRRRLAAGRAEVPPIAVVSGRLDLDWDTPFFTEAVARPIVLTHAGAPRAAREAAARVADVVEAGDDRVDLATALAALAERGGGVVLAEGGPSLLGALIADDLLDELCLTVAPVVAAGEAGRIAHAHEEAVRDMTPAHVLLADEGHLLLRYVRKG